MSLNLRVKRLDKDVKIPKYAYKGDAAFDLCAREEVFVGAGEHKLIPTGIAIEIPEGYAGLIWDKSSLAGKYAIKTLGGVIDSGYRGEIVVGLINLGKQSYKFEKGKKVAQMIIQKVEQMEIEEVSELTETNRGEKGFGSSGN